MSSLKRYSEPGAIFERFDLIRMEYTDLTLSNTFRTHTVILVNANNEVDFYEETMPSLNPNEEWIHTHIQSKF